MKRLRATLVLAGLLALMAPAVAAAAESPTLARLKTTHRMSVSVELVDRWNISTREECKYNGSGTFTVKLRTTESPRVLPEVNRSAGRWTILTNVGRGYREISSMPTTGTMTREDNTVANPSSDGEPCADPKTGCGTAPLLRGIKLFVFGATRRAIEVDTTSRSFKGQTGTCLFGVLETFHDPIFFGRGATETLRLRMPSARALRRRVVRVTDSDRTRHSGGEDVIFTDDVIRKATVTFTRR